jgi:acyl-CoA dehydrogenase
MVWILLLAIVLLIAVVFAVPAIRTRVISAPLMSRLRTFLPQMGDTERIALEAGTVWWDGELFSGNPDWQKLLDFKPQPLSPREQAFLDGPVEELCRMLDDWQITQDRELPPHVWDFLKHEKFLGMIIPVEQGGLGFSALAHSAVVIKIASRSITAACCVMVPNSLGPAELLLHYGTDEQRNHYLPRLASGEDIPCFALTEPHAGSDAASTRSKGVVCYGFYKNERVLGIRLNFNKRYITLAPIATVIGLAFDMSDPEGLLGAAKELGITCALIPRDTPDVNIGNRHDPLGIPFPNGPITGTDVFVPIEFVIGGKAGIGQGWRMLMECLAAGRSISLPSLSISGMEMATRFTGAYASIREQFGLPIGRFEGIEEPLARIAGQTYMMHAARTLTCGALDAGEKPAVLSGVVKAYLTDALRNCINDAMDIVAGAAICRGPRNLLSRIYAGAPLAITVEGANILTRSLIIFGQGSIRCHPFIREEMRAIADNDAASFDRVLFKHLGFIARNGFRSFAMGVTGARFVNVPAEGPTALYLRQLTRMSAAFALTTDAALVTLGGGLKRREKISGRLADALAWMYLASAAIKRFHDDGQPASDLPALQWSCDLALWNIQQALAGVIANFPNRFVAFKLRSTVFPLGARFKPPSDALGAKLARAILDGGELRERLTRDIFVPKDADDALGRLESTLELAVATREDRKTLREKGPGALTPDQRHRVDAALKAQDFAIQVDAFAPEAYAQLKG